MEQINQSQSKIPWWSHLRTRMAFSYVAVTLVIVLMLESLVVGGIYLIATRSSIPAYWMMQAAGHTAQVMALQAAVQADGSSLNPQTTFASGQTTSLSLRREGDPPNLSWFNLDVPYVQSNGNADSRVPVALLIDRDGQILSSSYPDRYPANVKATDILPEEDGLILAALQGKPNGEMRGTQDDRYISVIYPVFDRNQQSIGAVWVHSPVGWLPQAGLVNQVATVVIPSAAAWLCLMLPIGMIFGVFTTRGMIKRLERLSGATARFKEGDITQRVPVSKADEIGQLERQFNQMAEQIVENIHERESLAEQSARREERIRIEQELSSAQFIQRSLLPEELPSIPGWEIQVSYRPALEVGGDLYDVLTLPDGRIEIVIGDANGKGISSALVMATTVAMLRAAAPGTGSAGKSLALVNDLLQGRVPVGTFVTCFYAILDPANRVMWYANAGHNLPFVLRDRDIFTLEERGMPLGMMPGQEYGEASIQLDPADTILFYTDGLVEAHDSKREMYGPDRIKQILSQHHAEGLIENLLRDLDRFTGADSEQEDDITLLLLRKAGQAGEEFEATAENRLTY